MGCVYSLKYKNEVYVGETMKTAKQRFAGHKQTNTWIKALLSKGLQPEIITLELFDDRDCHQLRFEKEEKWKDTLRKQGYTIIEGVCKSSTKIQESKKDKSPTCCITFSIDLNLLTEFNNILKENGFRKSDIMSLLIRKWANEN